MRRAVLSLSVLLLWSLVGVGRAAAQTELLVVMSDPGHPSSRLVVTSTGGSERREHVTDWIVPSNGSGESPNVAVGLVRRAPAAHARRFTLVSDTGTCVVRSTEDAQLFAGITSTGAQLHASVVSVAACTGTPGSMAIAGVHPSARLVRAVASPLSRSGAPATLAPGCEHADPMAAPGQPFVVFASPPAAHVCAYCSGQLVAEGQGYLAGLLTIDARVFLAVQPDRFDQGALWRWALAPLACP